LFEASYTRELIALGERDAVERRKDVLKFFDVDKVEKPTQNLEVLNAEKS